MKQRDQWEAISEVPVRDNGGLDPGDSSTDGEKQTQRYIGNWSQGHLVIDSVTESEGDEGLKTDS